MDNQHTLIDNYCLINKLSLSQTAKLIGVQVKTMKLWQSGEVEIPDNIRTRLTVDTPKVYEIKKIKQENKISLILSGFEISYVTLAQVLKVPEIEVFNAVSFEKQFVAQAGKRITKLINILEDRDETNIIKSLLSMGHTELVSALLTIDGDFMSTVSSWKTALNKTQVPQSSQGHFIKKFRKELGMTQEQFAIMLEMSVSHARAVENNALGLPPKTLQLCKKAYEFYTSSITDRQKFDEWIATGHPYRIVEYID